MALPEALKWQWEVTVALGLEDFSVELFWDVDRQSVHLPEHQRWLVERVMEYGRWPDWLLLKERVSKQELMDLLPTLRISQKSRSFLELYCA